MKELFVEISFALAVVAFIGLSTGSSADPIESFIPLMEAAPYAVEDGPALFSPIETAEHRVDFIPLGALPLHATVSG